MNVLTSSSKMHSSRRLVQHTDRADSGKNAAVCRRRDQLPCFAPLFEEVELAGWSSDRDRMVGNFHDWLSLPNGRTVMYVGQGLDASADCVDAAFVAQGIWAAVRAHAVHAQGAGELISLVSRTLSAASTGGPLASLALGLVFPEEGSVELAFAGNSLGMRIRAASCETLESIGPSLGACPQWDYPSQHVDLLPRERMILMAGEAARSRARTIARTEHEFAEVPVETHRTMTADDTLGRVRRCCAAAIGSDALMSTSIVALRRR
jgi:hypothetical protein